MGKWKSLFHSYCEIEDPSEKTSAAQANGSMSKMSFNPENTPATNFDPYTQAITNRDQREQRKEDGSSGIFLLDNQNETHKK